MTWIDLEHWPRRAIHDFYLPFADPWFNLTTEVEAGPARAWCRQVGAPFSLACWYAVLVAVDHVDALRQRLRPGGVWQHERVRIGATVLKPDDTFTYAYYPHATSFEAFVTTAEAERAHRLSAPGLEPDAGDDDLLHCTVLPWVRFTAIQHARSGAPGDSVPKIALGRATPEGGGVRLPVSLQAHHAVVDGVHAGRFFQRLEAALSTEDTFTSGDP